MEPEKELPLDEATAEPGETLKKLLLRVKRIEARQKKMMNLVKGQHITQQMAEENGVNKVLKAVLEEPNGVKTGRVASLIDRSRPTALQRMEEIAEEYDDVVLVEGRPKRLRHRNFVRAENSRRNGALF